MLAAVRWHASRSALKVRASKIDEHGKGCVGGHGDVLIVACFGSDLFDDMVLREALLLSFLADAQAFAARMAVAQRAVLVRLATGEPVGGCLGEVRGVDGTGLGAVQRVRYSQH